MKPRVVFDCMIYVQALARKTGPAAACLYHTAAGDCELVVSDEIVAEIRDVVNRPKLRKEFIKATDEDVEAFFRRIAAMTRRVESVPGVVILSRDPKDAMYLNLAVAAGATLVVSRDNDLLDLMAGTDPDAEAFRATYPGITILDPVGFLQTIRSAPLPDSEG